MFILFRKLSVQAIIRWRFIISFVKRSLFDIYLIYLTLCLGESLLINQRLCKSRENSNGLDINKQICDNHRDSSDKSCFIYDECL